MRYVDTVITIKEGDRVAIDPATDLWMQGYRFGTVRKIGRTYVTVEVERLSSRRIVKVHPARLSWVPCAAWLVPA